VACATALNAEQVTSAKITALFADACKHGDGSQCASWASELYGDGDASEAAKALALAIQHKDNASSACGIYAYYYLEDTGTGKTSYWRHRCNVLTSREDNRWPPAYKRMQNLHAS